MRKPAARPALVAGMVLAATGASLVAIAGLFIIEHRSVRSASATAAAAELDALEARFAGVPALVSMETGRPRPPSTGVSAPPVRVIHTVVFDTRGGGRLVHVRLPFGLLRRLPIRQSFHSLGAMTFFDDTEFDSDPVNLPFAAVQRHGPGLLVSYRHPSGGRFVSWAE